MLPCANTLQRFKLWVVRVETLTHQANSLTDAALLEIILSKGRFDKRSAYPHFWAELGGFKCATATNVSREGARTSSQVRCHGCAADVRPSRSQGSLDC